MSVKMQWLKAALMMVVAKFLVAITTILYKLAEHDGMHMNVLITYRYLFASIIIFPLAFFLERNKRPKVTWTTLFYAFLCAFFVGPLSQKIYTKSLGLTSATSVVAITNLIPPFTFIVAGFFRLEKVEIGKITGKAKVFGTLVGFGGAMIITFYKGHQLNIRSIHFNLLDGGQHMDKNVTANHKKSTPRIFGSILALVYSLIIAIYYTFQSKLSVNYPCHYSNTLFYTVVGLIQSIMYFVPTERSWNQWKLNSKVRLLSAIFQGICSVLAVFMIMAAVHLQGPLFVSSFNPLVLVYVAIAGFLVLGEKLYVGMLLGSVTIIAGLYLVLWAKGNETKRSLSKLTSSVSSKDVNAPTNNISTTSLEIVSMDRTSFMVNNDEEDELRANSPREKSKGQEIIEEV